MPCEDFGLVVSPFAFGASVERDGHGDLGVVDFGVLFPGFHEKEGKVFREVGLSAIFEFVDEVFQGTLEGAETPAGGKVEFVFFAEEAVFSSVGKRDPADGALGAVQWEDCGPATFADFGCRVEREVVSAGEAGFGINPVQNDEKIFFEV